MSGVQPNDLAASTELCRLHARVQELEAERDEADRRAPTVPPITASLMVDDGGERPAYCVMAAYTSEKDARNALVRLTAAPQPQGWKLVPVNLLERIQESLGSFVSDQGWSQSDMDTADALDGVLARDLVEDTDPDDEAFDDFAEDVDESECHNCSGTGEGMYDSQSCVVCLGKGFL